MRILMLAHNWAGEGTYVRAFQLARAMARLGHDTHVLATNPKPFSFTHSQQDGVQIHLAPHFRDTHRGGWGWLDLPSRLLWVLNQRFDMVHAFDHKPNVVLPAWWLAQVRHTPLVSDWADWWSGPEGINGQADTLKADMEALSEVRIRRLAGWVTAISPMLAQRALDLGIPKERILLLPGGGDPQAIKVQDKAAARQRLGLDPQSPLLLFMGLGNTDLPYLISGFKLFLQKNPKARLILLGPQEQIKRQMAQEQGIEAACMIPGRVPDAQLNDWLSAADGGAIPLPDKLQNQARWPNKVGEYWAAGLPVLCNPVGPLAQLIKEKGGGLLVENTPAAWAEGMQQICGTQEAQEWGKQGRMHVESFLSWDNLALQLLDFYKQRQGYAES
jgi:glycosyltransferase involved in cell wall biosynthesis